MKNSIIHNKPKYGNRKAPNFKLDFNKKKFTFYEKRVFNKLVNFLRLAEADYYISQNKPIPVFKSKKYEKMAIYLMNNGVFSLPILPGENCYYIDKGKVKKGKVKQIDTTVTDSFIGAAIFYDGEDGERFFHSNELGETIFFTQFDATQKLEVDKK